MKLIGFFNNKGGVGKTSLVYHLAWMMAETDIPVVAADFDPQANLTSMFLLEAELEQLWPDGRHPNTLLGVVEPIMRGLGDIAHPHVEHIANRIGLIPGDLGLSTFEDKLSAAWPACLSRDEAAFRTTTALFRAAALAAQERGAEYVLVDVGPNLGAINRAAIISCDAIVIPLASDLFSLQGLRNLGPQLHTWRSDWTERKQRNPDLDLPMPSGEIRPAGYVVMQHAIRQDRPAKSYLRWMQRIPGEYRQSVLRQSAESAPEVAQDPHCLATLKHYRSLMPLAMEARKPIFLLKPSDGAIGAHVEAVRDCYGDFAALAGAILKSVNRDPTI